jgi:hypothetical protein
MFGARAALLCGPSSTRSSAAAAFGEQFFLCRVGIRIVNERDFLFGDSGTAANRLNS